MISSILIVLIGFIFGFLIALYLLPLLTFSILKKRNEILVINYVDRRVFRVPKQIAVIEFPEFVQGSFDKYPILLITDNEL